MNYKKIKSINDVKLTTEYVPYITKIAECKNIAEITSHKEVAGKKIFSIDSPIRHLWYIMKIVDLYTDIEFEPNDITDAYDILMQNGVLDALFGGEEQIIPNGELIEFKQVMDMVMDDMYENERSSGAILGNMKDAIAMVFESMLEAAEKAVDENKSEFTIDDK